MLMITTSVRLYSSVRIIVAHSIMGGNLTWSTGFMATPRVLGHELRLTANLCLAREASAEISLCSLNANELSIAYSTVACLFVHLPQQRQSCLSRCS